MQYKSVSIHDPRLSDAGVTRDGVLFEPTQLHVPGIAFGDTDPAALSLPQPAEALEWPAKTISLSEVHRFRIGNAVVHAPYGIITIQDLVLEETLGHIPFHLEGYARDGNAVTLPDTGIATLFATAIHVMGGNYNNYFHWIMDILPKLQIDPLTLFGYEGVILLPPNVAVPISDIATRMAQAGHAVFSPGRQATQVQNLLFIQNLCSWGFAPNPHLGTFFSNLKRLLGVTEVPRNKIYVSRRDSRNRILLNEDRVIETVQAFGYQVVELSGLDLVAQARLFAGASHIVAPHGAGLANLVFCDPGVTVCELHMNTYLNWCFRRLAGIQQLKYGCLVGIAEPGPQYGWVHNTLWSLPVSRLEAVLASI